jgi:hypothetical protein
MMKRITSLTALTALAVSAASPSLAAPKKSAAQQQQDAAPVVTPDTTAPPIGYAAPTGTVQMGPPGSTPPPVRPTQGYTVPIGGGGAQKPAVAQPAGPPEPPVIAAAEQCLRTDAETAARAEPSTKLGVDLLIEDLCGPEVDAAALYLRNAEALTRFNPVSERGRAGLSVAHVDPETGQIVAPPGVDVSSALEAAEHAPQTSPPKLRKYAADLILSEKVRLAAMGKKSR